MKFKNFVIIINAIAILAVVLNITNSEVSAQNLTTNASSNITLSVNNETYSSLNNNYQKSQIFTHGLVVKVDNTEYYFDGPADGANGTKDAPGHYWWQDTPRHLYGLHYNVGPL